jgi:hypothetical protein
VLQMKNKQVPLIIYLQNNIFGNGRQKDEIKGMNCNWFMIRMINLWDTHCAILVLFARKYLSWGQKCTDFVVTRFRCI